MAQPSGLLQARNLNTLLQDHKQIVEQNLPSHVAADLEEWRHEEDQQHYSDTSWEDFHARENARARFYKERR